MNSEQNKPFELTDGCILTVANEIYNEAGTVFIKGQKVEVEHIYRTAGRWSRQGFGWISEKIDGVRIKGKHGMWFLSAFEETKPVKP